MVRFQNNMKIGFLIFVFGVSVCVLPTSTVARKSKLTPRIINGMSSLWGQFPFYATLEILDSSDIPGLCGGTILNDQWILTAAHCLQNVRQVNVHLGSVIRSDLMEQGRSVHTTYPHNFFIHLFYLAIPNIALHDVGLIYLENPIQFSETVQPVRMPQTCDYTRLDNGVVMGFGVWNIPHNRWAEILQWMTIKVLPRHDCEKLHATNGQRFGVSCAEADAGSTCAGDSGSPVVSYNGGDLLGIAHPVTYPNGCEPGNPMTFTNILPYLSWISQLTGMDLPTCEDSRKALTFL